MIKGMHIGFQVYSVRDEAEADFEGTLRRIKAMGYEGVEFAGLYGMEPAAIAAMTAAIGLTPISAHVPIDELLPDPAACIARYKAIGCRYIAIPWLEESRRPGQPGWDGTKAAIAMIADECARQDMTLLYHNHDFEFVRVDGEYVLDRLYADIPALQTEIDTCWVKVAGEDPAAYVRRYAGRAPVVHLKDYLLAGEKPARMYGLIGAGETEEEPSGEFEYRPLGYGSQDVPSLVDAAAAAGTGWVIVELDMPGMGKTPLECAEISLSYLNSLT